MTRPTAAPALLPAEEAAPRPGLEPLELGVIPEVEISI